MTVPHNAMLEDTCTQSWTLPGCHLPARSSHAWPATQSACTICTCVCLQSVGQQGYTELCSTHSANGLILLGNGPQALR